MKRYQFEGIEDVAMTSTGVRAQVRVSLDGEMLLDVATAKAANEAIFSAIARIVAPKACYRIVGISTMAYDNGYLAVMTLTIKEIECLVTGHAQSASIDEAQYQAFVNALASIV